MDTRHKLTAGTAVGSKNQSIALGEVIPKDTIQGEIPDCLSPMTEGKEESQQFDPTQIQGTVTQDAPFQVTHQERKKDKEIIRQLMTKNQEAQNFNKLKNSGKLNKVVLKITKHVVGQENQSFCLNLDLEIVKPFTSLLVQSVGMMKHQNLREIRH